MKKIYVDFVGRRYMKERLANQTWWHVLRNGDWYVISGRPSVKLVMIGVE